MDIAHHNSTRPMKVLRKQRFGSIAVFDLIDEAQCLLPHWTPGSHIEMLMKLPLGDEVVRQYSLCGNPEQRRTWRIAVLREQSGRGGSQFLVDHAQEGHCFDVRGPRSNFRFADRKRPVFIAAGIGITPILPMARAAAQAGLHWQALYLGRTETSLVFRDDLTALGPERVTCHVSQTKGRFALREFVRSLGPDHALYACGPQRLLDDLEQLWAAGSGWELQLERFENPNRGGRPGDDEPFEVVLAKTGLTLTVPPERSILEVVQEAGVDVDWSCRDGVCGTCETRVLDGLPRHKDAVLGPDERETGDYMMICVSRARSDRLVLDL